MGHKKLYIICYDIEKDKSRTKLAKIMEQYGKRVNYSVFECMLTDAQHRYILGAIQKIINPKTDKIKIYLMCQSCFVGSIELGVKDYTHTSSTIFIE